MDTTEVAQHLGTTPRQLRAFLRSPISTFVAVGSGARYDFTDKDIPLLKKRFAEWLEGGRPKSRNSNRPAKADRAVNRNPSTQDDKDRQVWSDEESSCGGVPELEDIRKPGVRKAVKKLAAEQEQRLMLRLLACGMHISQLGDRVSS